MSTPLLPPPLTLPQPFENLVSIVQSKLPLMDIMRAIYETIREVDSPDDTDNTRQAKMKLLIQRFKDQVFASALEDAQKKIRNQSSVNTAITNTINEYSRRVDDDQVFLSELEQYFSENMGLLEAAEVVASIEATRAASVNTPGVTELNTNLAEIGLDQNLLGRGITDPDEIKIYKILYRNRIITEDLEKVRDIQVTDYDLMPENVALKKINDVLNAINRK